MTIQGSLQSCNKLSAMIDPGSVGLYDANVSTWRCALAVIALSGAVLARGSPAQAQDFCQVVSVPVSTGGFALTPLDAWAFATVPAPPMTTTVRHIIVCQPTTVIPVFTTPVMFAPPVFVVDPPSTPPHTGGAPSGRGPGSASDVTGVVPPVTVRDLAQNPGQYDRQVVSLVGDAAAIRTSYNASGTRYTEIRLESGGASVVAVAWGTPKLDAGERVRVTGNFYAHTPFTLAAGSPVHNVLEAVAIETLQ
jgi:hypothetical protein